MHWLSVLSYHEYKINAEGFVLHISRVFSDVKHNSGKEFAALNNLIILHVILLCRYQKNRLNSIVMLSTECEYIINDCH